MIFSGVFKRPVQGELAFERDHTLPITVILDGLKDPGNAGTIIRTAAAIGCDKVIATRGKYMYSISISIDHNLSINLIFNGKGCLKKEVCLL